MRNGDRQSRLEEHSLFLAFIATAIAGIPMALLLLWMTDRRRNVRYPALLILRSENTGGMRRSKSVGALPGGHVNMTFFHMESGHGLYESP